MKKRQTKLKANDIKDDSELEYEFYKMRTDKKYLYNNNSNQNNFNNNTNSQNTKSTLSSTATNPITGNFINTITEHGLPDCFKCRGYGLRKSGLTGKIKGCKNCSKSLNLCKKCNNWGYLPGEIGQTIPCTDCLNGELYYK